MDNARKFTFMNLIIEPKVFQYYLSKSYVAKIQNFECMDI